MIRPGFLDKVSRQDLTELARDGLVAHRLARRANALVSLDDGMSCAAVAKVLLLDDGTIRTRHVPRGAKAWVARDDGMSCAAVAKVLLLDDGTIRTWHRLYGEEGIGGLANFGPEGSACRLSDEQRDRPQARITE